MTEIRIVATTRDGYTVEWSGGHGLHLCDVSGREVAYRTVGDQATDALTLQEAADKAAEWARWIDSGDRDALEFR